MRLWILLACISSSIYTIPAPQSGIITKPDVETHDRTCIIDNITDHNISSIIVSVPADERAIQQDKPPVRLSLASDGSLQVESTPGMPELRYFHNITISAYTRRRFITRGTPMYLLFATDTTIIDPNEAAATNITYNGKPLIALPLYKDTDTITEKPHVIVSIFPDQRVQIQRYTYYG